MIKLAPRLQEVRVLRSMTEEVDPACRSHRDVANRLVRLSRLPAAASSEGRRGISDSFAFFNHQIHDCDNDGQIRLSASAVSRP
jgi:hypothetical protein